MSVQTPMRKDNLDKHDPIYRARMDFTKKNDAYIVSIDLLETLVEKDPTMPASDLLDFIKAECPLHQK